MPMPMELTLGDLLNRLDKLDVRCRRCPRRGWVKLDKLIAEHGADIGLPDLAVRLATGCPRANATSSADRCSVHFPQLRDLPPAS
jgi:hypothetical protein